MMEGADEAQFGAMEWTIENFSCWHTELHHAVITSLNFFGESHFEIRPMGMFEPVVVRMLGDPRAEVSGDLSLIATDGYVFCSEEVEIDSQRPAFQLSSAPTFHEVESRSKMNDGLHKDQITLRFQIRGADSDSVLYMRTAIRVHEFSIRIPGEALYNIFLHDLGLDLCIRTIEYPSDDGATEKLYLYASLDYTNAMDFKINKTGTQEKAWIRSRTSVIGENGKAVRSRIVEPFCLNNEEYYIASDFLTRTEVEEKRFDLLFCLRVIPEDKSELLCTYNTTDQGQTLPMGRPASNTCVEKPSENIKDDDTSDRLGNSVEVLTEDLMCLYQDQDFSDITLKCDNVTFPVHKNILSARSPVFKTMLSTDMAEASSGEVDIGDLDPSTLSRFLTFLYTGALEGEVQCDRALKLYYAANKYQVPVLRRECAKFLCASVSISNVRDILSLADKHQDHVLTAASHNFILNNYNSVLKSNEWAGFMSREPLLAVKTLTHFAAKDRVRMHDPK